MARRKKSYVPVGAIANTAKRPKFPTPSMMGYLAEKGQKIPPSPAKYKKGKGKNHGRNT